MLIPGQNLVWLNFIPFTVRFVLKMFLFRTFKDMSLFSYQGSLFAVPLTALLVYHAVFVLSRTFFNFFLGTGKQNLL